MIRKTFLDQVFIDLLEQKIKDVVKFVKENPKWSVSLQTHKYLEID